MTSNDEYKLGPATLMNHSPYDTLSRVQLESGLWRATAYPDSVGDSLAGLAGVTEEVGELAHALLKHHQGIRGYDIERTRTEAGDAIADTIIYLCHVADTLGLNVADELSKAWAHVKSRNIVQNSDPGNSASAKRGFAEMHRDHPIMPRGSGPLGMPQPGDELTIIDPICPEHGNTCTGDVFHTDALSPIIDYGTNFDDPSVEGRGNPIEAGADDNAFAGTVDSTDELYGKPHGNCLDDGSCCDTTVYVGRHDAEPINDSRHDHNDDGSGQCS